jgi:hypothetical protein
MAESGSSPAVWCAAILALAVLALALPSGRVSKATIVASITILLMGMILAALWL